MACTLTPMNTSSSFSDHDMTQTSVAQLDHSLRRLSFESSELPSDDRCSSDVAGSSQDNPLQTSHNVEKIRAEVKKLILLCLHTQEQQQQKASKSHHPSRSIADNQRIASQLEDRLYRTAPSLWEYSDMTTLERRLRVVLRNLRRAQQQASIRRKTQHQESKEKRVQILQKCLGPLVYQQVHILVQDITVQRNQLAGSNCAKCQRNGQASVSMNFDSQLPDPVRDLYFNTPLVEVWGKYSAKRLCRQKHTLQWQELIRTAQDNLDKYLSWKAENSVCNLQSRNN